MGARSKQTYRVREADVDDVAVVAACWHAMRLEVGLRDEQPMATWRACLTERLVAYLEAGAAKIWLAETEAGVVGTTVVLLEDDLPIGLFGSGRGAFLGCVYTVPAWRCRGIATNLIDRAIQWARQRGVPTVRLLRS